MNRIRSSGLVFITLVLCTLCGGCQTDEPSPGNSGEVYEPILVSKTNSTKIYIHYMPWFHSKEYSGYWGSHWRMANKNPENFIEDDKREIAAHYYPLIGPYDSGDPHVIEYHLLLMKYAGIDGVLIDWYGTHRVLDYYSNLENSNALIHALDTVGLQFGIVYEEFTAENVAKRKNLTAIEASQLDMTYMEENYFNSSRYIHLQDQPLLLTFGPRYFKEASQWTEIFSKLAEKPIFLPLWGHSHRVGEENSGGEFSWIDFNYTLEGLESFYNDPTNELVIGSAFPGFHDYYEEGGWGQSYGYLSHLGGETFENTLLKASEHDLDYVQLVTWNDFGEGTMIEPTQEFGFDFLVSIQKMAGVVYTADELQLIYDLYKKRKEYNGQTDKQIVLDQVFTSLNELRVEEAETLLNNLN